MVVFNRNKLADIVRNYRTQEGLSLRELSERCGGMPSFSTISRIENPSAKLVLDMPVFAQLMSVIGFDANAVFEAQTPDDKVRLDDISTQLRASKTVSTETLQALAAIIQAVQAQTEAERA